MNPRDVYDGAYYYVVTSDNMFLMAKTKYFFKF